jgi:uncharacterized membrane protein
VSASEPIDVIRPAGTRRRESTENVSRIERGITLPFGGLLILGGMRHRGLAGAAVGIAGVVLVARGWTGRCPLYRRLGIDTAHRQRAAEVQWSRTITVGAPLEAARAICEDPSQAARVVSLVARAEAEGDRWRVTTKGRPGRTLELTLRRDADAIEWRTAADEATPGRLRLDFSPAPGNRGTEISARLMLRPPDGAVGKAIGRGIEGIGERWLGTQLARLKQLVETGEIARTGSQPAGPRSALRRALRVVPVLQEEGA